MARCWGFWRKCECSECTCCSNRPTEFTVVVSGVTNQFCSDCAMLNGTFVLPFIAGTSSACSYSYVISFAANCGSGFPVGTAVFLVLSTSGSDLKVEVTLTHAGAPFAVFEDTSELVPFDCTSISELTLTKTGGPDFLCNGTAASVVVTAG